jgi:UDP-N-acetylglucosamine 2-epimerase (non-hydrolysing)
MNLGSKLKKIISPLPKKTDSVQDTEAFYRENLWEEIEHSPRNHIHMILIATKPDIIKQAPLYHELKKRGEFVLLCHTGQHYDYNLSTGVLEEFHMDVDINLNIYGPIHKKFSLIIERLGNVLIRISELGKTPIPYVHGDTLTAASADKAAFLNKFAVVHVEAGIRTFSPNKAFYSNLFEAYGKKAFDWNDYYQKLQDFSIYERGSIEPFPEQFCTRSIEGSASFYAVSVPLYKDTLGQEGFVGERIHVTGNTIVDAVEFSREKIGKSRVFDRFENMRNSPFLFITIHRRENCEHKERFLVIYHAIRKLVESGTKVCFLGLNASENAIDRYGLRNDLSRLVKEYGENFAYAPALAHHTDVIKMISEAGAIVTDSGSMQEEANIVGVPCVTVRFGTDRVETVLHGSNVLCPPINSNLCVEIIKGAIANPKMKKDGIYGKNVSAKIVDGVLDVLSKQGKLFQFDSERLDLEKYLSYV